ncbi:LysR substrate-binding domain-containing protein [Methylophaga thiooxydans]|uniref:LysR substrate binding domain protein n=1 Tax=Methylophaga thiooxydans DMS010 TaxID=637616 RepID=C0N1T0_9GAMM|nr:LysR substrate-binding domain-containing protein [Methylophaga thiooxydans]EEF81072.1 LysR substrate binding domain protein [Methylophaga thiooxydans DMS010]
MNIRHLTPSTSLLLAFEAAARYQSYRQAADELSVTQSAISKQIHSLETHLNLKLFEKVGRNVELTDAGKRYYSDIKQALGIIRNATLQALTYHSKSNVLNLAVLPTFGSKWLLPKLHDFYRAHPEYTIHILSRIGDIDFDQTDIDAAVTVGTGDWRNICAQPLLEEQLVAIASPSITETGAPNPAWLTQQSLLSVNNNMAAWNQWFESHQQNINSKKSAPSFDVTAHLIQAVRAGLGVGLVPINLIEDELQRGELIVIGDAIPSQRSYYLIYPERNMALPALSAFSEWLEKLN